MLTRFSRIQNNYGTMAMARMILLIVGLGLMIAIGFIGLSSPLAVYITVIGLTIGFLLRNVIPLHADIYPPIIRVGLYAYGVTLVVAHWMDLDKNIELAIITITTLVIFNLNFWTWSSPLDFGPELIKVIEFMGEDDLEDEHQE